jgi:hypothetical protein
MLTDNFETHAQRFLEPSLSPKDRLALAQEIRESIEIVQTSEYGNFLQHFVGAFNLYRALAPPSPQHPLHTTPPPPESRRSISDHASMGGQPAATKRNVLSPFPIPQSPFPSPPVGDGWSLAPFPLLCSQ